MRWRAARFFESLHSSDTLVLTMTETLALLRDSLRAAQQAARRGESTQEHWARVQLLLDTLRPEQIDTVELSPHPRLGAPTILAELAGVAPEAIVRQLLKRGADPSRPNCRVGAPLADPPVVRSAWNPDPSIIPLLCAAGADPNDPRDNGLRAIHVAAQRGSLAHVDALLRAGADPLLRARSGQTAFDYARAAEAAPTATLRRLYEAIEGAPRPSSALVTPSRFEPATHFEFAQARSRRRLGFVLLAAKAPPEAVAESVCRTRNCVRLAYDGIRGAVTGAAGIFVVGFQTSSWSVAYLDLGSKDPGMESARPAAEMLAPACSEVAIVTQRSLTIWRHGSESAHSTEANPADVVALELPWFGAYDVSDGVHVMLELHVAREVVSQLLVIVLRE